VGQNTDGGVAVARNVTGDLTLLQFSWACPTFLWQRTASSNSVVTRIMSTGSVCAKCRSLAASVVILYSCTTSWYMIIVLLRLPTASLVPRASLTSARVVSSVRCSHSLGLPALAWSGPQDAMTLSSTNFSE